jgi:methylthioribose-1-phosphate isomerase
MIKTIEWTDAGVVMIDQRRPSTEELYPIFKTYEQVANAIEDMVIQARQLSVSPPQWESRWG